MNVRYDYGGKFSDGVPYPVGPYGCIWFMRQRVQYRHSNQLGTFWIGRDPFAGPGTGDLDMYIFEVVTDDKSTEMSGWYHEFEGALGRWEEESERVDFLSWEWED